MKILNVAEKNDAAKELARIMSGGRSRRHEGYSKFNKIYTFDYHILNTNAQMIMTSVSGHMMELEFTSSHKSWSVCMPVALFSAPVKKYVPENFINIKRTLEREIRGCQVLIIWTDCDREGENIGFEVIDTCRSVRPNIQVYRAQFSEITPQSITRACNNLARPDKLVSDAVDVRSELDLRIGAAFTRFQTLRLQKVFPEVLSEQVISYGSCQFPTLGFVVERYKQVQQFVPETFFKIKVTHQTEEGQVDFSWKRVRLFNHTACLILYQMCMEEPTARVLSTSSRPKSKWRPVALDTVELEKLASRKLRISAKETMKIAEKLYNQGLISYPRTETNIFPSSLDLRPLVQDQTQDPSWGAFAANVLAQGPNPRNGRKSDQAHPPIHPTKYTGGLQGDERRVYDFITRHFLACCSQDAQGQETKVEIQIACEQFTATGLMILARNYLDVYPYENWTAKTIPVFREGEEFQPHSIEMIDGETNPPPLLSEADLIALMEKHGIGTDATHAEHIEKIKSRNYVGVQADGTFLPGELGMGLVEDGRLKAHVYTENTSDAWYVPQYPTRKHCIIRYDLMGFEFSKPRLRAELEADLKRICEGRRHRDEVLAEQIQKYKETFVEAATQAVKLDEALSQYFGNPQEFLEEVIGGNNGAIANRQQVRLCPKCKVEQMVLKKTKEGSNYLVGCQGYPECRAGIFLPKFVLEANVTDQMCRHCQPAGQVPKLQLTFKRGSVPPMMPLEYIGCVFGCDAELREVLDIRDFSSSVSSAPMSRGTSRSSQHGNAHQGSQSGVVRGRGTRSRGSTQRGSTGRGRGQPSRGGWSQQAASNFQMKSSSQNFNRANHNFNRSMSEDSGFFSQSSASSFSSSVVGNENCVVCSCGNPAIKLTVKKDGPNKGREFYKCFKRQEEGGCNFFVWADDGQSSGTGFTPVRPLQPSSNGFNHNTGGSDNRRNGSFQRSESNGSNPVCNCGNPAVSRTVSKEGPNKGRPFFCCSKPIGQGCGFFEWADEGGDGQGPGRGRGRGRGGGTSRGGFPSGRGGSNTWSVGTKKRKCGICNQEGHTRRNCPRNR